MEKKHAMVLWVGGILAVFLLATLLVVFTDNRVGLALRSYRRISKAETMALSFSVETSHRSLSLGLEGTLLLDVPGQRSRMRVELADFFLPLSLEFYQEPGGRFMQTPFLSDRWIPLSAEVADSAMLSETYRNLLLDRRLREVTYLFRMDRTEEETQVVFQEGSFFEVAELEQILARLTGRPVEEIRQLNLTRYEVRLAFGQSSRLLEEVEVTGWFLQMNQEFPLRVLLVIDDLDVPLDFIPEPFR